MELPCNSGLLTYALVLQNIIDISDIGGQLKTEGYDIEKEDFDTTSPYLGVSGAFVAKLAVLTPSFVFRSPNSTSTHQNLHLQNKFPLVPHACVIAAKYETGLHR